MNTAYSAPEHCSHPMVRGRYVLETDPMNALLTQIATWIDLRVPGGFASAPTRFGKSRTAIAAAEGNAADILPLIPLFLVICKRHVVCSESEFLREILRGIGHSLLSGRSAGVLRERVINFLAVRAETCGQRQVVLLCDEAQNNHAREYHTLCGIQNELDRMGIVLTVISIGSPELKGLHQLLVKTGETYLAARFFHLNVEFRGIRNENELRFVLEQYDSNTEWPGGSGLSYTKYFFPNSFADGFRVEDLTPYLWGAFLKGAARLGGFSLEVPMEHIAHSVEEVFRTFSDAQVAEQSRSERDRTQLVQSFEKILKKLAFSEYMNGLIHDLRGESK